MLKKSKTMEDDDTYMIMSAAYPDKIKRHDDSETGESAFETLQVSHHSLIFDTHLSQTDHTEVWRGELKITKNVAIKTLKPGTITVEAFLEEASVMRKLRHKNLVQLYAVCSEQEPVCIVTELMTNGSLLNYLRCDIGKHLALEQLISMCAQIANGMAYIRTKGYVHGDLTARSVFVGDKNVVKIGNFRGTRSLKDGVLVLEEGYQYQVKWSAPEVIFNAMFTDTSDIWSFGIVIYEIMTRGAHPYSEMSIAEVVDKLGQGYRLPSPFLCPQSVYKTMRQCWQQDPEDRPTFEKLYYDFTDYSGST